MENKFKKACFEIAANGNRAGQSEEKPGSFILREIERYIYTGIGLQSETKIYSFSNEKIELNVRNGAVPITFEKFRSIANPNDKIVIVGQSVYTEKLKKLYPNTLNVRSNKGLDLIRNLETKKLIKYGKF